ncbi:Metacaspase-1 [Rhizoctonia solani AG-1 IB]|uniref:Metacaspase-1 n=1 Tax=Thanatephorus cucumeris (strain AG1-IB / isolate 7/3/14) TaxID=1108050 RepID=M5BV50_THACB|nr:Metacaspase-1 [Rhizoctonia solani AG-1 IB]
MLSLKPAPDSDPTSDTRGSSNQAVTQGQRPSTPEIAAAQAVQADLKKQRDIIKGYMQASGPLREAQVQAQSEEPTFRALIIAPQYRVHLTAHKIDPLNSTLYDVVRIHRMLINYGYKASDIRILAEGLGMDVLPTRQNILKHLEWLVKARKQDHRFLHFSGHGTYFDATAEDGKQAASIENPGEAVRSGDLERDARRRRSDYTQAKVLDATKLEMKYYKEAIIASYDFSDNDELESFAVFDKELNAKISMLPEGCKFTCVFDCCHSGRMLNCNLKLDGGGFRGAWFSAKQTDSDETSGTRGIMDAVVAKGNELVEAVRESKNWSFGAAFSSAPRIELSDGLPEEERNKDGIKADVIFWSACHQRQPAKNAFKSGLFTDMFTRKVEEQLASPVTVDELWKNIKLGRLDFKVSSKLMVFC